MNPFNVGFTSTPSFPTNRHLWEGGQESLDREPLYSNLMGPSHVHKVLELSCALANPTGQQVALRHHAQSPVALRSAVPICPLPQRQENPYVYKEGIHNQRASFIGPPYPMTGVMPKTSPSLSLTQQQWALHNRQLYSTGRLFSAHGMTDHQRFAPYHQGPNLTSSHPLTSNASLQTLPQAVTHTAWQQEICSMPEQAFNEALDVYSSEEHQSALHKHLALNKPINNYQHGRALQPRHNYYAASHLDSQSYNHGHDPNSPPYNSSLPEEKTNQVNNQDFHHDTNTSQDRNGSPSLQRRQDAHAHASISNEIQNLRAPSPNYEREIDAFFADFPPQMISLTSLPSMNDVLRNAQQPPPFHVPQPVPITPNNEWDSASNNCAQDTMDCSASHQEEAELHQNSESESTPSSEEYLIERNPFDEGPDDGSLPQEANEAGSWTQAQPHQAVSLATSNVSPWLPPSNEGHDLTKSSQPSVYPGDITENHLPREEVERGSKRKRDAEVASERSQPQRHTNSAVSSPSGPASSASAQGNIQKKKERKIYTLTESVGDNFRYQRVPRPENQGGGFTESYQSSTNPEGRFTSAEHRLQESSTESKRKREEEDASETSQPERPVKRIRNSSASSASSSSSHSSSSSPPMPSQEAVAEENNTKRKKKLLRDKLDGPFWLQRIPEQEKELVHIAETVSPAEQVPGSEENES
ncbi:hypothetical protein CPB84DRAFT_1768016 [Gymnopilus junonius]|uniref:Uncharacterized protein n=1 Tax=Gymnopilus junonius TaxID=109634 RepID=A0A9P5NXL5_GYMJU|nr:hypothetical protein CPB84DRAFT_1768016 [Gymnopilus junonius]